MRSSVSKLQVDFVSGAVAHRLRFGGGRGQALAKAMGLRAGKIPILWALPMLMVPMQLSLQTCLKCSKLWRRLFLLMGQPLFI